MKILVTGANGFVGYRLANYLCEKHDVYAMTHQNFDLLDEKKMQAQFEDIHPDAVVHLAGISSKIVCEENPKLAYQVIVEGTEHLAKLCAQYNAKLIFSSSDQVYEGDTAWKNYKETDIVNPQNKYAGLKLEAEQRALATCDKTVCLRLTAMYDAKYDTSREHANLLSYVLKDIKNKNPMYYSGIEFRGFTNVNEVIENIPKTFTLPGGIYNFGSENTVSTYELMKKLMKDILQDDFLIHRRDGAPLSICMDTAKMREYGIVFSDTSEGLRNTINAAYQTI